MTSDKSMFNNFKDFGFLQALLIEQGLTAGVHKTGIRGIQDTRQIVDGKINDIENNDKKGGSKLFT